MKGNLEGLKVGLEIHQQAGRPGDGKLFCGCPADIVERQPDLSVTRRLKASAGETGKVDVAAAAEVAKGKKYTYHAFHDVTCLVELDEEPPHPVNREVLKTAVMVAKACGSTILPKVQFMRKTVVDGSATSGFQRTGLFAFGGIVPEIEPPVRLQTICVEEDSAKIITRTPGEDTYNLSRLGVPLIEVATEPDITTPQQAQEVAAQLGMILRSTKRVKRGLGTIRQDLNISVPGGTRVEVKGCQDLRMIPTIIEYEAMRQRNLLDIKGRINEPVIGDIVDVTEGFAHSTVGFVKSALAKGDRAIGFRIKGWKGILGTELCPNYRVGSELADIARSRGFGGLIHSDEKLEKYGADADTLSAIFGNAEDDSFILLIGDPDRIRKVFDEIIIPRIRQFPLGVLKEVRKANPDGTTSFLRPMPGAARMYPETDIPIVTVDHDVQPPKLFSEQVKELKKETGLSEDLVRKSIVDDVPLTEYKSLYPDLTYSFLSGLFLEWPADIAARKKKEIHPEFFTPLLGLVVAGALASSSIKEMMENEEVHAPIDETQKKSLLEKYSVLDEDELIAIIREAIKELPDARSSVVMGKVMRRARGKADGKRVMELIEQERGTML